MRYFFCRPAECCGFKVKLGKHVRSQCKVEILENSRRRTGFGIGANFAIPPCLTYSLFFPLARMLNKYFSKTSLLPLCFACSAVGPLFGLLSHSLDWALPEDETIDLISWRSTFGAKKLSSSPFLALAVQFCWNTSGNIIVPCSTFSMRLIRELRRRT